MIAANRRFEGARPSAKAWLNNLEAEYRHARPVRDSSPGGKLENGGRSRCRTRGTDFGKSTPWMAVVHGVLPLHVDMMFRPVPHDVTSGGWRLFARSVAITFLVLVGVSMVLTAQRKRPAERNRQWLERGAKVFGWGLLISVVTRIFLGEAFVLYGILHLIGTAFLLAPCCGASAAGRRC